MLIKHIDGSETETDKLPDLKAFALEKSDELLKAFSQYNIPFIFRFGCVCQNDAEGIDYGGCFSFSDGEREPFDVKLEMLKDNLAAWERLYPAIKIVVMKKETYEQMKDAEESERAPE